MSEPSWVSVFGFGAVISATKNTLIISQKGKTSYHPLNSLTHLIILGNHTLQTSALSVLSEHEIPVTFFTAGSRMLGTIPNNRTPPLRARQLSLPAQKFALAQILASNHARMLLLHELSEKKPEGIFYKGELEIMTKARDELQYLVTMQEYERVLTLNKNMYYEILSRAVPKDLGYKRLTPAPFADPVNVMFSLGYAVVYAKTSVACTGAGLDTSVPALFKSGTCVHDIIEAAKPSMVDKVVIELAEEGKISGNFETGSRCILSESLLDEYYQRLHKSISRRVIEENVKGYADAVKGLTEPVFRY